MIPVQDANPNSHAVGVVEACMDVPPDLHKQLHAQVISPSLP